MEGNVLHMKYVVEVRQNHLRMAIVDKGIYFQQVTFKYEFESA